MVQIQMVQQQMQTKRASASMVATALLLEGYNSPRECHFRNTDNGIDIISGATDILFKTISLDSNASGLAAISNGGHGLAPK